MIAKRSLFALAALAAFGGSSASPMLAQELNTREQSVSQIQDGTATGKSSATGKSKVSIRFASNSSRGLTELAASGGSAAKTAPSLGTCFSASETECSSDLRIARISGAASALDPVQVRIDGEGVATNISVLRNAIEIKRIDHAVLPVDFTLIPAGEEGAVLVNVEMDGRHFDGSLSVDGPSKNLRNAQISSGSFRFFANVAEEGNWEVITGLGNGGRLWPTSNQCIIPGLPLHACPASRIFFGITDRAQRGETVLTLANANGVASRLGVIINGRIRGEWRNVPLPTVVPQNVSLSPFDDNVIVFAVVNGVYAERRLPIGRRPF